MKRGKNLHHEVDYSPDVEELVWDEITHDVDNDRDMELQTPETIIDGTTAGSYWVNSDQNKYVETEKGKQLSSRKILSHFQKLRPLSLILQLRTYR